MRNGESYLFNSLTVFNACCLENFEINYLLKIENCLASFCVTVLNQSKNTGVHILRGIKGKYQGKIAKK